MEERSALFGLFARREISWNNTRRGAARRGRENAREKLTRSICRGRAGGRAGARARPADGGGGGGEILLRFVTRIRTRDTTGQYLIPAMECRDATAKPLLPARRGRSNKMRQQPLMPARFAAIVSSFSIMQTGPAVLNSRRF